MKIRLKLKREEELKTERSVCYPDQEWVRGRVLGRGAFGSVHMAYFSKINAPQLQGMPSVTAVKSTLLSSSEELDLEKEMLDRFHDCPNIVRCFGKDITYTGEGDITKADDDQFLANIFLEFASGGTLSDLVSNSNGLGIPEPRVRLFTKSILKGLYRIHQEGFVHCDIKLENVLLVKEDETDDFVAKIADLGLVKSTEDPSVQGTASYWAPEISIDWVQGQPSDIWALGCVVLEMLTATRAWDDFGSLTTQKLVQVIATKSPTLPCGIFSDSAEDFLYKCFRRSPQRRPTAEMLLNHPFVGDHQHTLNDKKREYILIEDSDEVDVSIASPAPHKRFCPVPSSFPVLGC